MTVTYKRVRRILLIICPNCSGSGYLATKHGSVPCRDCAATGNVERWIVEIVASDDE